MDKIDAFPEYISTTVMPVTLPEKPDALTYAARQGHVRACIIYQEPNTKRVFVLFCKGNWYQKKSLLDNFKRAILEAKHVNEFKPDNVLWEKISKGLLRNPDRPLKNTDKRMKKETLRSKGLQATTSESSSCTCRDKQKTFGTTARAFFQKEKSVYHTRHHTACGSCVDCQTIHGLVHPQPVSIPEPSELTTSQIPDSTPSFYQIHLATTPQILLPDHHPTLRFLLPDPPPELTTSQILLPDPPVVESLEPTLPDDSSMDQIMSSVFGDYLQQGIPSAHTQEPQVLVTVPSLFDESNDRISFLDHFEAGLAIEQQEAPMDLTMPH
ncbi:uncharacterized protein TNCV_372741 [Trichonephila clavipes]|nr:uncharacterized protein TNCV_372741 [Trichonephila clavipes]